MGLIDTGTGDLMLITCLMRCFSFLSLCLFGPSFSKLIFEVLSL